MAARQSSGDDLIHNVLSEDSGQSSFACNHCRRQKVKCDRILPHCGNCKKASRDCSYPLTVQKPGPKAGTHRRPRGHPDQPPTSIPDSRSEPLSKRARFDDGTVGLPTPPSGHTSQRPSNDLLSGQQRMRHGSTTTSTTSHSPRATNRPDNLLVKLVHPVHEPDDAHHAQQDLRHPEGSALRADFSTACYALRCSAEQGWEMIRAYFNNMTSVSLFHKPTFEQKLGAIKDPKQLQAFLSALFSYALRFKDLIPSVKTTSLSATAMLELSSQLQQECLESFLDDPPLHLLQSYYLVTFQKLIHGVRGMTWRMLGDCIRLGYELRLHLIDANAVSTESEVDHDMGEENWILSEERRRMWWALWEMDVFTSTIRRLPGAVNERLNFTFLPSADEDWFAGNESRSCFLVANAMQRWKEVADSGTRSPSAWYILINSYMYDAHEMGAFPEVWKSRIGFDARPQHFAANQVSLVSRLRDHVDECSQRAYAAMPRELSCDDRFLAFKAPNSLTHHSPRALDSARFCIHVMYQLLRIMMCIWGIPQALDSDELDISDAIQQPRDRATATSGPHTSEYDSRRRNWDSYIDAANQTAEVIRNSAPLHYQYVNPLIANAIWYAASALVVAKLFGPPGFDARLAQSNFDLLVSTLNKFELFWQIPSVLKQKLRTLEGTLNHLKQKSTASTQSQVIMPDTDPMAQEVANSMPAQQVVPLLPPQNGDYLNQQPLQPSQNYGNPEPQGWDLQEYFDFNTIPTLGLGNSDFFQTMPFDLGFDNNMMTNTTDGPSFNDLFVFPYQ